ncbi:hypothetical protein ACFSHR_24035 [Azotobacter chroococcum]
MSGWASQKTGSSGSMPQVPKPTEAFTRTVPRAWRAPLASACSMSSSSASSAWLRS